MNKISDAKKTDKEALGEVITEGLLPAAKQFGGDIVPAGETAARIVNKTLRAVEVALSPIYALVWGADKIEDWINRDVQEKLKNTPPENLITPDPTIAGPTIEAMKFRGSNEELRNLFANLLANSLDKETAPIAHPAYVEIIKQLTPDEAKIIANPKLFGNIPIIDVKMILPNGGWNLIIKNFSTIAHDSGCRHPELTSSYVDNICRLEICRIPSGSHLKDDSAYETLFNHPYIQKTKSDLEKTGLNIKFDKKYLSLTDFGVQFIKVCVTNKG